MSTTITQPLLEARDVSLSFGSVRALANVSVTLVPREITAIVGDNGAGKSTLVRCFSGIHKADSGDIVFDGETVRFSSPESAREAGIETVHQNLALVEDLTVWQNLFLNRELTRCGFLDGRRMRHEAGEMVRTLAVNVPEVTSRVRRLSGGQRQAVSICRAAGFTSRLVIMDEPTAALGVQETARVEEFIPAARRGARDSADQPPLGPDPEAQPADLGDAGRPLRGRTPHRRDERSSRSPRPWCRRRCPAISRSGATCGRTRPTSPGMPGSFA